MFRILKQFLPAVTLISGLLSAVLSPLQAAVLYVSPTGSDAFIGSSSSTAKATITAAISAAQSGDTIRIASGTYTGDLNPSKSIVLQGAYAVDFQSRNYALYRSTIAGQCRFSCAGNFTMDGLIVSTPTVRNDYPAVYLLWGDAAARNITISNCTIQNSSSTAIALVVYNDASATLTIASNTLTNCMNGIDLGSNCPRNALIYNNVISSMKDFGTTFGRGNGIFVSGSGIANTIIASNTITNCENYGINGGGYNDQGPLVKNNRITLCGWGGLGAGINWQTEGIRILNNVIVRNTGFGLCLHNSTLNYPLLVKNNTIANNTNDGVRYGVYATYKNNVIASNSGGGINEQAWTGSHGEIGYNVFGNNTGAPEDFFIDTHYEPGLSFKFTFGHDNIYTADCYSLFVDTATGDYHLRSGSLAIDAGDPADAVGEEPSPNGGRIDCGAYGGTVFAAASETIPPAAITDLQAAAGTNSGEINLVWSAPGDDGTTNRNTYGATYFVRCATCSLAGCTTAQWWDAAVPFTPQVPWIVGESTPLTHSGSIEFLDGLPAGNVGIREHFTVYGLIPGSTYFFMVRTQDNSGNLSGPDERSLSDATMARAAARAGGNRAPVLGYTINNVLGSAAQRAAADLVDIAFRVADADGAGDTCTFAAGSAQYRIDGGVWLSVSDARVSFSASPFVPATDLSGTAYTATWNVGGTVSSFESDTVEFRLKVTDGDTQSLYGITGTFTADDKAPSLASSAIESCGPTSVKLNWYPSNDLHFDQYYVRYATYSFFTSAPENANRLWSAANDPALANPATVNTVVTGLAMNTSYWFMVQPRDTFNHEYKGGSLAISTRTISDSGPPGGISNLTALKGTGSGEVRLQWTAPGDDGAGGSTPNGLYEIKCSSAGIITALNYDSPPYPAFTRTVAASITPGQQTTAVVTGLVPDTYYWFAIKARDDAYFWSVWNSSQDIAGINTAAFGCANSLAPTGTFSGDFSQAGGALYAGGSTDEGYGIVVDTRSAGGPYVYTVGVSSVGTGSNPRDWLIIKYDVSGNKLAATTFNGAQDNNDYAYGAALDADGNLLVAGPAYHEHFTSDYYVIKYSSSLEPLAAASYNGPANGFDTAYAVTTDAAGNVVVAGQSRGLADNDIGIVKFDPSLTQVLGATTFDSGTAWDYGYAAAVNAAGEIIVAGSTYGPSGNNDFATFRYSADLSTLLSSATLNGTGNSSDNARGIAIDGGGNVIVTGETWTNPEWYNILTVKYDPTLGVILSSASFNGTGNAHDYGRAVTVEPDGSILVAGYVSNTAGNNDYILIRYNGDLSSIISSATYNSGAADAANAIAFDPAGYAYVTGNSNNDMRTVRFYAGETDNTPPAAVADLAAQPGTAAGEVKLSWSSPGDNGWTGPLASGAQFKVQYSTSPDGNPPGVWASASAQVSVSTSGVAPNTPVSCVVGGLAQGTTCYFRMWYADRVPNWSPLSNGATAAAKILPPSNPGAVSGVALSTSSILWNWTDAADNESGYRVLSDTGGIIIDLSANTTCWLEGSLAANTSWYRYAEACNAAGSSSGIAGIAFTLANPPLSTAFTAMYLSSVSFQWSANDNSPATVWGVYRSIDNFTASTTTLKNYASGYTSVSYTDTDLAPGTSYYYKVRAFNGAGISSAFDVTISTCLYDATPPAAVTDLSAAAGTGAGEILLTWSAPGNDGIAGTLTAGSLFGIQYSTDPATAWSYDTVQATLTAAGVQPFTVVSSTLSALVPAATYYIRLWTRDGALNWSALSNAATAQSTIFPPSAPAGFTATALSTGSIRWSWTDAADNESGYRVLSDTGGVIVDLPANTTCWLEGDLAANTSWYRCAETYNAAGSSAGIAGIAVTFANYPTDTVFTGVYLSSVSFQWSANDNPPNTVWGVYRSTDNFTASTSTLKSFGAGYTATSYDDTGLLSDASYYYKVRAFNGSGIASAFGVIISTYLRDRIPPQAVTTLTAQAGAQAGKILLTWSAPGDDGMIGPLAAGSLFGIQYSTDPATAWSHEVAQTTIAAADFPPFTVVSSTLTALVPGTTYYIRLWTRDGALNWSALSNGATAAARIAPPAQPSGLYGTALSTGAILWNWPDAFSGETQYLVCSSTGVLAPLPADTTAYLETDLQENSAYERYLRVQSVGGESAPSLPAYRRTLARAPQGISVSSHTAHSVMLLWEQGAAAAFRVDISSDAVNWTTTASSITSPSYSKNGLRPGTTWHFRLWCYNGDDVLSAAASTACAVTDALSRPVVDLRSEDAVIVEKKVRDGIELEISVDIPQGTVEKEVYVDINTEPAATPTEAGADAIDAAVVRIAGDRTKTLLPDTITEFNMYDIDGTRYTGMFARAALIGIPYRDGNGDGMIDGAFPPLTADNLKLYVLNEGTAEWVLVGGTVNKAKKRVEAEVRHFSVYTLVGTKSSAQDLRGVIVYPNPCRAGAGQTGRVVFSHLTAHALLRIYTIAGELVCEAREDDSDGRYEWPLTTASGGTVASGIYIYVVTNPDNAKDKHTGKLAIIK